MCDHVNKTCLTTLPVTLPRYFDSSLSAGTKNDTHERLGSHHATREASASEDKELCFDWACAWLGSSEAGTVFKEGYCTCLALGPDQCGWLTKAQIKDDDDSVPPKRDEEATSDTKATSSRKRKRGDKDLSVSPSIGSVSILSGQRKTRKKTSWAEKNDAKLPDLAELRMLRFAKKPTKAVGLSDWMLHRGSRTDEA